MTQTASDYRVPPVDACKDFDPDAMREMLMYQKQKLLELCGVKKSDMAKCSNRDAVSEHHLYFLQQWLERKRQNIVNHNA